MRDSFKLSVLVLHALRFSAIFSTLAFFQIAIADGFIDELNSSSIFLDTYTSGGGIVEENGTMITLTAESQSGAESRSLVDIAGDTNSVEVMAAISSSSSFSGNGRGDFSLLATLFNDTQDGGHNGFDGDMVAGIQFLRFADGFIAPRYCVWRKDVAGIWQSSGFFNGSSCSSIPVSITEDTTYKLSITIDRVSGSLTFALDNLQNTYAASGAANLPSSRSPTEISNKIEDLSGKMVANVFTIKTDSFDTSTNNGFANIGRYDISRDEPGAGNVKWNPGDVELAVASDGTTSKQIRIRLEDVKDSLSARLLVSSDSELDQDFPGQRFAATVSGFFYNDIADNGVDGGLGDVFATTEIRVEANGGLTAYYCLSRSNAADFGDFSDLLDNGTQSCIAFSSVPTYDTYYTVSVTIDRIANKLLFSFNGETAEYDIQTPAYLQATNFRAIRAIAFTEGGIGATKVKVDHIATTDSTDSCNGLPITVDLNKGQSPGPGNDVVLGTPGNDDIRGRAGNDTICGMGGNDFIHGNSGDDWIDGGDGVDNIRGGQGSDILFAGSGATVGTASRVFGGNGNDSIFGGPDADDLRGGRGDDMISGEQGADSITGNDDDDTLYGGPGIDTLKGGNGENDQLFGEDDDDSLNGGSGSNDFCDGGGQGGDTDTNCEVF